MSSVVHDFEESLAWSNAQADGPWWKEVYRRAFPDLGAAISVRDDGWAQRGGIDRVLMLASGRTLWVDEKVRQEDWPDVLLEFYSDYERRVPGWIEKDLASDYIAYAFLPSQTCYLFPFQTLRAAWRANKDDWIEYFQVITAQNRGYTSLSVAVPTEILMSSLTDAMRITWGGSRLKLAKT